MASRTTGGLGRGPHWRRQETARTRSGRSVATCAPPGFRTHGDTKPNPCGQCSMTAPIYARQVLKIDAPSSDHGFVRCHAAAAATRDIHPSQAFRNEIKSEAPRRAMAGARWCVRALCQNLEFDIPCGTIVGVTIGFIAVTSTGPRPCRITLLRALMVAPSINQRKHAKASRHPHSVSLLGSSASRRSTGCSQIHRNNARCPGHRIPGKG